MYTYIVLRILKYVYILTLGLYLICNYNGYKSKRWDLFITDPGLYAYHTTDLTQLRRWVCYSTKQDQVKVTNGYNLRHIVLIYEIYS